LSEEIEDEVLMVTIRRGRTNDRRG